MTQIELTEVGPGTPAGELLRRFWQPVGLSAELTDLPRAVRILGEDLALFRDGQGRFQAIVLDPRVEMELRQATHDKTLAPNPARLEKLIVRLANEWRKATARGAITELLIR